MTPTARPSDADVREMAACYHVGCSDHGQFYVADGQGNEKVGEVTLESEIDAIEYAIGCASDCRNSANASLRHLRARLRALRRHLMERGRDA